MPVTPPRRSTTRFIHHPIQNRLLSLTSSASSAQKQTKCLAVFLRRPPEVSLKARSAVQWPSRPSQVPSLPLAQICPIKT